MQIKLQLSLIEQSAEWNSSIYINLVDFEKACHSLDRTVLLKLMSHYGIPKKYISLVKNTYEGMNCKVIHSGTISDSFQVKTGVRQGCVMSPFLFLLAVDWIMKETTANKRNGIQWTLMEHLDDLDFADDLALLSHNYIQMQNKSTILAETAAKTGLNINIGKTNNTNYENIKLGEKTLEDVTSFCYLGSTLNPAGGTDEDVKIGIGKARAAFTALSNIWKSIAISKSTKIRLWFRNMENQQIHIKQDPNICQPLAPSHSKYKMARHN